MYGTKLLMDNSRPIGYIEDESLVFSKNNTTWTSPSTITISNLDTTKAFTFCGTLPNTGYIFHVINYRMAIYRTGNKIFWRDPQKGGAITSYAYSNNLYSEPYIAATLYFPTPTTQTVTMSVEGGPTITATGSWNNGITATSFKKYSSYTGAYNLLRVYDRVLTKEELD